MAVTKIKAIKATVYSAIKYITNPAKTDGTLLASGFNCEPTTAYLDFQMTALLAKEIKGDYTKNGGAENLAYHLIQSFSKTDKITPEKAHEIGKQLADEIFQGKHEYVITTHIDKGHIHNHIIANAVSFLDFTKFRTRPYETARIIREASDKLCRENGLHVIEKPQGWGKDKFKWQQAPSWRDRLQLAVDNAIFGATDYAQFVELLKSAGVEIKEGKHIAFRMPGQFRFLRGKSMGLEYSRERIKARILNPNKRKVIELLPGTHLEKQVARMTRNQVIAKIHELGDALLLTRRENINAYSQYDLKIAELKDQCKEIRGTLKELNQKNKHYRQVAKCLVAYEKYLPLVQELERTSSWRQKGFLRKHESELLVFKHAHAELAKNGIDPGADTQAVLDVVKQQTETSNELQDRFKETETKVNSLEKARKVIASVIYPDQEGQQSERKANRMRTEERIR